MHRTPVIIGKISPTRANSTPTRSGGVLLMLLMDIIKGSCFALKGLIFKMTGDVLYIIPLITRLLAKTKK